MATGTVQNVSEVDFSSQISSGIALVDFWAPWCGPCMTQLLILEEVSKQINGKAKILKVNVDESSALASQYRVSGIPTLILFKDGAEADRFVGVQSQETLVQAVEQNL